ncbi:MAG: alpha-hydroxy acid oxidase [Oceanicoccus sp.]
MTSLDSCYNIADLRAQAKRKLPAPMFHYIDGGADDEWTLQRNSQAFSDYQIIPNHLRNIESIDLRTNVLGASLDLPFFLAPTGMSRLFHHQKEPAACRAANEAGTLYSLSTLATTSLEEVAVSSDGPKMFQIYVLKDRGLTREFVQRCKDSHYQALCLTVDTTVAGNRERDLRNGMTMPPKITMKNFFSYGTSFEWLFNLLLNSDFKLANVAHRVDALGKNAMGLIDYVNSQFDRTITWDDAAWLAEQWNGPFVIKGLQSVADVKKARDIGATGVMISNHGGRQLDGAPAPVDCISVLRDAVGTDLELICDGGIRRGTDIIKAIGLGADACSIGRPYLYGLAAGGQLGVARAIDILKTELERSLALMGCCSIGDVSREQVVRL